MLGLNFWIILFAIKITSILSLGFGRGHGHVGHVEHGHGHSHVEHGHGHGNVEHGHGHGHGHFEHGNVEHGKPKHGNVEHTRDLIPGIPEIPEIIPDYDYGENNDRNQQGPFVNNGCGCHLFAERELVYQFIDTATWYSCSPWGLYRCGLFCDGVLEDTNYRNRSRQNACDTLGREINTPWYRRHQVCGEYGPYEDYQMREDLCCRRGRPSDNCETDN